MRVRLTSWLLSATLGATLLGSVGSVAAQPHTRDHRTQPPPPPPPPPVVRGPTSAPPPSKVEQHDARRRGFVYVNGHWDWKNNGWVWMTGRWERVRAKKHWHDARWEQRGSEWVYVDGAWDDADERPRTPPPPPREDNGAPRNGFIYVKGYWEWENGGYEWEPGHYEAVRQNKQWREAHWEQRGNEWVFVEGAWVDAPRYPTTPPPPPQNESAQPPRTGFVWQPGFHEWRNGQYVWVSGRWERERADSTWVEGKWEQRGDHWEFVAGHWGSCPKYPSSPPPPLQDEAAWRAKVQAQRPGEGYQIGYWAWENCRYKWMPGGAVGRQTGKHFVPGEWVAVNGHYEFRSFHWEQDAPAPRYPTTPPPPPPNEAQPPHPGMVWVPGYHEWRNGAYAWTPGHWEKERTDAMWIEGKWEQRGDHWEFVAGHWGPFPKYPTQPPPPLQDETAWKSKVMSQRPGEAWQPGYWDWQQGRYKWMPGGVVGFHPNQHMVQGGWVPVNDHYEFHQTYYVKDAPTPTTPPHEGQGGVHHGPRSAPPPPQNEAPPAARAGFIWVRGHYQWVDDKYVWMTGRWERERAAKHWKDPEWQQRGDEWIFIEGHWD